MYFNYIKLFNITLQTNKPITVRYSSFIQSVFCMLHSFNKTDTLAGLCCNRCISVSVYVSGYIVKQIYSLLTSQLTADENTENNLNLRSV